MLALRQLATLPFTPCCGAPTADVAIGDEGVVVNQSWLGHMTTIGVDGETTDVPIDDEISGITYGPGSVVHGLRQGRQNSDFAIVAVGEPTMPVIAEMHRDGSVRWWSIPDGWTVVASDVWGTVLARITAESIDLALADW